MSSVVIAGNTSGSITISAPDVSGSNTLTLPVATDTLVGKATTDTLTNKTLVAPTITGNLTTTGNVGIGTASPENFGANTHSLTLDGTGSYNGVAWRSNGTVVALGYTNSTAGFILGTEGAIPLSLATNGTERMRIDSSGNLFIGKTGVSPSVNGWVFGSNGSGGTDFTLASVNEIFVWNNISTAGSAIIDFRTAGTSKGRILWTNANTTYSTTSDYRLKENIAPMIGALATIAQLKPVTYSWKDAGFAGQGFIAHELAEVVPDCVTGEKDAVDAEGKIKPQGIDTSFLVATLTAAIQELKAIVDAQAVRIAALES